MCIRDSSNRIEDYYLQLRQDHPIHYEQLALTAKTLKTIQEDMKKTAINYFRKSDLSPSEDESDSNKNLIDQMLMKISQIDCPQNNQEKSAQKKRWWTQEED